MNSLKSRNGPWLQDERSASEAPAGYAVITRQMVDAMAHLIAPDKLPPSGSRPAISRIIASASARCAVAAEILKPEPDLHVLQQSLGQCHGDPLFQYTECVLALLDRGHGTLAGVLLDSAPVICTASPETRVAYMFAMLRLGRLSSGCALFHKWQEYLANLPSVYHVLASFQLGLWHLVDATNTLDDPRFLQHAALESLIARELLRCIAGHSVSHSDLKRLRHQPGLHEYAQLNLGVLCREAGAHSLALELLPQDSPRPFAQFNRAVTLLQIGEHSVAKRSLAKCNLPSCIMNGHALIPAQMQELGNRLTQSYGQASTMPYFHFITQLTIARLSFPLMPLREVLTRWHSEYEGVWRRHAEGFLISEHLVLPETTS